MYQVQDSFSFIIAAENIMFTWQEGKEFKAAYLGLVYMFDVKH